MWVTEHFTLCLEYSLPCRNASEHSECNCLHKPWKVTGAFRRTTKWETCKGFFFREPHYIANDLSIFSLCWWVTTQHHPASLHCYSMYQSTAIYDVRCGCGILKWQTDTVCLLMCWISHWFLQRREKLLYFSHTFLLCWTNPICKKCRRRTFALKTENKVRNNNTHTLRFFCSHVCNKKDQICCTRETLHTDMDIHIFRKKKSGKKKSELLSSPTVWTSSCFIKPVKV